MTGLIPVTIIQTQLSDKMKKTIFISFAALCILSCSKQDVAYDGGAEVVIDASIHSDAQSRAVLSGTEFVHDNTIGLFVYHADTDDNVPMENFTLYGNRYGNIHGQIKISGATSYWKYKFENASTTFDNIYLMKPSNKVYRDDRALKICGYAPWIADVKSITSIPFSLGGLSKDIKDYMWVTQNGTADKIVFPETITQDTKLGVKLTFNHAMALLKIGFRCEFDDKSAGADYVGTTMSVSSVTLKRNPEATWANQTPLHTAGTLDALTGALSYTDGTDGTGVLTIDYSDDTAYSFAYKPGNNYMFVPMLICPETYQNDDDYILEFTLNGMTLPTTYKIKMSDVEGGFKAGHVYTFKFTFDNTINFKNIKVEVAKPDQWTLESINLPF